MDAKPVLMRLAIDLGIFAVLVLLVGAAIMLYSVKYSPEIEKGRRHTREVVAEMSAQDRSLAALGGIDLEPQDMTLASLQAKLHAPGLRKAASQTSTSLGWACGQNDCTVWATFPVPFREEIPQGAVPENVKVIPPLEKGHNITVFGIRLGESKEEVESHLQRMGIARVSEQGLIRYDEDWSLDLVGIHGEVDAVGLQNETLFRKHEALRARSSLKEAK